MKISKWVSEKMGTVQALTLETDATIKAHSFTDCRPHHLHVTFPEADALSILALTPAASEEVRRMMQGHPWPTKPTMKVTITISAHE